MQSKTREKLSQAFLSSLNEGRIPWKACWQSSDPENAVTGKQYRGVNSLLLSYYATISTATTCSLPSTGIQTTTTCTSRSTASGRSNGRKNRGW